jgi:hypothetical protein
MQKTFISLVEFKTTTEQAEKNRFHHNSYAHQPAAYIRIKNAN